MDDIETGAHLSWVESANGHPEFPIQNLPFGVFSSDDDERPRGGVAIGDEIFDISAALSLNLFSRRARDAAVAGSRGSLNDLMSLGSSARRILRFEISCFLSLNVTKEVKADTLRCLRPSSRCTMHLPARVGNFTDFFCGIHHAASAGRRRKLPADAWLPANYHFLPIAYHGRASSVRVSGHDVRRPFGQTRQDAGAKPAYCPSRKMDYEFELAIWIGAGNRLGDVVPIGEAADHIFGYGLLNDWSARDIQAWEMQPLGAFLSKNMCTTVSPWIVTPEALEPFRASAFRREGFAEPLLYLSDETDQRHGGLDVILETHLLTEKMRQLGLPMTKISQANTTDLYWTSAQMVAQHTSNGCNLESGDLFGSGTISASPSENGGCMLELSENGEKPLRLPSGEIRSFLEDGDEVILTARCVREGQVSIGFGQCRGRMIASRPASL